MSSIIAQPRDILSIIELVLFIPILVLAIIVCCRHGFSKQLGWLSIVILACFRISASSTWIAASYISNNSGLVIASIILQNFGLASLLVSIQGLLGRLNTFTPEYFRVPKPLWKLTHLATSLAIGLAIAGAVELGDSKESNDSQGHNLQRAAMVIFAVLFVVLCAMNVQACIWRNLIKPCERPILIATSIALPVLTPRILVGVLAVFGVDPNIFSLTSQNNISVIVSALMATLPEFIIAAVILAAGFKVPNANADEPEFKMEA